MAPLGILLSRGWLCSTALVGGGLGGVMYWWIPRILPPRLTPAAPSHASSTLGACGGGGGGGVGCMCGVHSVLISTVLYTLY